MFHSPTIQLKILIISYVCSSLTTSTSLRKNSSINRNSDADEHRKLELHWYQAVDPKTVQAKKYDDYDMAYMQSGGFFYDIPQPDWLKVKEIAKVQQFKNPPPGRSGHDEESRFYYQDNWEPDFSCHFEERIGLMGDGGKWVCDPHRIQALSNIRKTTNGRDDPCLVYSIGSNGHYEFELGLMDVIGENTCEIHTFEILSFEALNAKETHVLEKTEDERRKIAKMHFHHNWGLRGSQQAPRAGFHTLEETIRMLGHEGRIIDIFKLDCDGCEWDLYPDWAKAPAELHQILVEVHGVKQEVTDDFFYAMGDSNYVIFHKEPSSQHLASKGTRCMEYGFLKLQPDFIND